MSWSKKYKAVLLKTAPSEPDRLFTENGNYPRLWDDNNAKSAQDTVFMLIGNGIKADLVTVTVTEVLPNA